MDITDLRAERERRRLTLERAAGQMGVAVSTVHRWENGEAVPTNLHQKEALQNWLDNPVKPPDPDTPEGEFQ